MYRVMRFITSGQFDAQTHFFNVKVKQAKQRTRNLQGGTSEYNVRNMIICTIYCELILF